MNSERDFSQDIRRLSREQLEEIRILMTVMLQEQELGIDSSESQSLVKAIKKKYGVQP